MNAARARRDPARGQLCGLVGSFDDRVVLATAQAYRLRAEDIDGGNHFERQSEPHDRMLAC